jgi:hypothetical protein
MRDGAHYHALARAAGAASRNAELTCNAKTVSGIDFV